MKLNQPFGFACSLDSRRDSDVLDFGLAFPGFPMSQGFLLGFHDFWDFLDSRGFSKMLPIMDHRVDIHRNNKTLHDCSVLKAEMDPQSDVSVKVAVRIRPLNASEIAEDCNHCVTLIPGEPQVNLVCLMIKLWFMFVLIGTGRCSFVHIRSRI